MATKDPAKTTGTDVAVPVRRFSAIDLHDLNTFEDAKALLLASGITPDEILDATDIGDGFRELTKDDKMVLVGTPFLMLQAIWREGDYDDERGYYQCHVMTGDSRKFKFSDGSTGIAQQIRDLVNKRNLSDVPPIICRRGLSVSTYDYVDPETGKNIPASTYYLDTAVPV